MKVTPYILLLAFTCSWKSYRAQQYTSPNFGINIGIVAALGNKFDRFGVTLNSYFAKNNFQVNGEVRCYFNFKNLGPQQQYLEAVTSLGVVYGYGLKLTDSSFFFNPVSNQMQRKNSIGYAFNYYFNGIGTHQQTGTIALQFRHFHLIADNDIFARPQLDRFRTGSVLIQYRDKDRSIGLNTTMFTGEMGKRIRDKNYPHSNLYKTAEGGKYSNLSHGLFSLQMQYVTPNYQLLQGNAGIDAERVRHIFQNRLIHDLAFLPKKWRAPSKAHVPMLDTENSQYLFKEEQKVKPPQFYFNLFSNPNLFY